jgi:hypothetical protein
MFLTKAEKHALVEAASVFESHGLEFRFPWECDLDDRENELYTALVKACRAYAKAIQEHTR